VTSPLPHAEPPGQTGSSTTAFDGVLRAFSVITMVMTVPQVVSVWSEERGSSGVSLLSWGTYLVSACLWLFYGVRKRNRTLWLPCVGWIALDAAIVIGLLVRR
jgi:uncharacterized protein with PQ loop repeat